MTVDHHVDLTPEERAELELRDAEDRRAGVQAAAQRAREEVVQATAGPAVRPRKSRLYYSGHAAHGFAAVALVITWAAGAAPLVCLPIAAVVGAAAGVLYHRAPRVWSRILRATCASEI